MSQTQPIIAISDSEFEPKVIERSYHVPVVVHFGAKWAGPSQILARTLEKLVLQANDAWVLVNVDVDKDGGLVKRFGIEKVPVVKTYRAGRMFAEFEGNKSEKEIQQFIANLVSSATSVKPHLTVKEYKFTCKRCGNVWYVNKEQLDNLVKWDSRERKLGIAAFIFGRSDIVNDVANERRRNELMGMELAQCPRCRSQNFEYEDAG